MNLGGSTENVTTPISEGTTTNEIPEEADTSTVDASAPNVQVNDTILARKRLHHRACNVIQTDLRQEL